jgi:hypothetical protein
VAQSATPGDLISMGKLNALWHAFSTGEVSTSALARVDHEKLRLAAEIQENFFPHVIGKGQARPGTGYIGTSYTNAKARYLPFIKSPTDTALIECTSALLRFWVSDALVTRGSVTSTVSNSTFATASATITMTQANPCVVTWTSHGFSADQPVSFESTTNVLAGTLVEGTVYYVKTVLTGNTFTIAATVGGTAIDTSSAASTGTLTGYAGWGVAASAGATVTISGGVIAMSAAARGSTTTVKQAIATSNASSEHALRIIVTQGTVLLRAGSSDGGADYVTETSLGVGTHSIAFTPTASPYYITFGTRTNVVAKIDSCVVEGAGTLTLPAPWSEADLPLIRIYQSQDVVFMACASWQPRKIERRNSGRSWSIVKYEPDDGPFITADTNRIRMTLGAAYGITTLTASAPTFTASHVGSLVRVFPEGQNYTFNLAAQDTYTEAVRLAGVGNANDHTWAVSGTWAGTISRQVNYDSGTEGFTTANTIVVNSSGTEAVGADHDNVVFYVRYGFKTGEYTSGVATINLTNTGGGKAGVARITAYTSSTSVDVQILSPPGSLVSTANWQMGAWSDVAGWPSSVGFFDGRLFWGGLDKFWGSESDDYYAFNLDDQGDSGSIQRAVATGGTVNAIRWMLPLHRLILGASGAEVSVRSSSLDEPLTPTNVSLKDAATQGVAAISPIKMDGRGIYIHRDGLQSFEVTLEGGSNDDYQANSLMLLNDTIGGDGFVSLAIQRSPQTYIWHVRADGQCVNLLYDVKEKSSGWFRFIAAPATAGAAVIEDVVVLPSANNDRVYLSVRRTINGSTVRYLEKLARHSEAIGSAANYMADSYITVAGPITTVTGLTHLIGETVVAWGTTNGVTGPIGTTYTVNGSGEITLPSSATNVCVGLAYTWRYKSAKLAYGAGNGTALLQPKRVATIGLVGENIHPNGLQYGADFTTMYSMPRVERGQALTTTTMQTTYDEPSFAFGGIWDTDSRVCLKGSAPYPCTVNAMVLGIESNED